MGPWRPDHLEKAREALVAGATAMVRGDAAKALHALCTANHHIGAALYDGSRLNEYAEVAGLASAQQLELGMLLRLLQSPARGAA